MKIKSFALSLMAIGALGFTAMAQEEAPATAAGAYNDALELMKEKKYADALPLLEQAIELADPEDEQGAKVIQLSKRNGAISAYYKGTQERKDDNLEGALAAYEKGIGFNEAFYANYLGRAQTLEEMDKDMEAMMAYLEAEKVCLDAGKADKADKAFKKAEILVGRTYSDGKHESAIMMGQKFLEIKESEAVHYYIGASYQNEGENDQAIAHIQKAMELSPEKNDKYLYVLAETYEAAGNTAKAVEAYKQITDAKFVERAQYKVNQLGGK